MIGFVGGQVPTEENRIDRARRKWKAVLEGDPQRSQQWSQIVGQELSQRGGSRAPTRKTLTSFYNEVRAWEVVWDKTNNVSKPPTRAVGTEMTIPQASAIGPIGDDSLGQKRARSARMERSQAQNERPPFQRFPSSRVDADTLDRSPPSKKPRNHSSDDAYVQEEVAKIVRRELGSAMQNMQAQTRFGKGSYQDNESRERSPRQSPEKGACFRWASGRGCRFSDRCRYSHVGTAGVTPPAGHHQGGAKSVKFSAGQRRSHGSSQNLPD